MMSIRRRPREVPLSWFDRVQTTCRQGASGAAEWIVPAALMTRDAANSSMLALRVRSAPWLQKAGTYVATDLGPRVGGMLSNAALRMEPPKPPPHRRRNAAMMTVGAVSAMGLAGALLMRRGSPGSMAHSMPSGSRTGSAPADVDGQVRTG